MDALDEFPVPATNVNEPLREGRLGESTVSRTTDQVSRYFCSIIVLLVIVHLGAASALAGCDPHIAANAERPDMTLTASVTGDCGAAELTFYKGEEQLTNFPCNGPACEKQLSYDTSVLETGSYAFGVSTACQKQDSNGCSIDGGATGTTVPVDSTREATPTYSPDQFGHGTVSINYTIKNARDSQRGVMFYTREPSSSEPSLIFEADGLSPESGTVTRAFNVTCHGSGTLHYLAGAHNAVRPNHFSSEKALVINGRPKVTVTRKEVDTNEYEVTVAYKFPNTDDTSIRGLKAAWVPSPGFVPPSIAWAPSGLSFSGTASFTVTAQEKAETIEIIGTSCTNEPQPAFVQIPERKTCCGTPSAVGDPVRISSGNMRYVEDDQLPGSEAGRLERVFDTTEDVRGFFGHGWTSIVDAWMTSSSIVLPDIANPLTQVTIATEGNDRVIFTDATGSFQPAWPTTDTSGEQLSVATSYVTYTSTRAKAQWTYRRSDGHLVSRKSLVTGRELTITWDSNALPTRADDSWGAFAWLFDVDSESGLITSVTVEGTSITRAYAYDEDDLTGVTVSDSTPWRTYTYSSGNLTAIHDASGNLLESHTYDSAGNATDSHGPSGEITDIEYNRTGRVTDERLTRVTWANGKVVDYYVRPWAGDTRTFEVRGGCSSCSSQEDGVYAYDEAGNVIREQNGRGYITTHTYDDEGRANAQQSYLRPASCNPSSDVDHCRLTPEQLASATLTVTPSTVAETFTYGDANWPSRPTQHTRTSARKSGDVRTESFTFDVSTGEVLTSTVTGWTGVSSIASESHVTTTALYGASEDAAFSPCGGSCTFQTSWESLDQPLGRRKSVDGPRSGSSDKVQYVYYPIDNAVSGVLRGRLAAVKDAAGLITRFEDYDAFGNARRVVDPNGVITESTYDGLGRRLTSKTKADGGCNTSDDPLCATDITSQSSYEAGGGPLATNIRPGGGTTAYEYESRGRLASVT